MFSLYLVFDLWSLSYHYHLFNIVVFLIIVDPVGRITETINTTIQQTRPQQQHFTTPETTEEGTDTSDVYEAE